MLWAIPLTIGLTVNALAADRTTLLIPIGDSDNAGLPVNAVYADEAFGDVEVDGWNA